MSDANQMTRQAASYEGDFYAWTQDQARRLRAERPRDVDWANLAQEVEELGSSKQSEIESRLHVLLIHLLKWQAQPTRRKAGWRGSIVEQRARIARVMRQNPSLAGYPKRMLAEEYKTARIVAADETELPDETFPRTCPFTIDQVLNDDFWPEGK
jgi:hypothetical protein